MTWNGTVKRRKDLQRLMLVHRKFLKGKQLVVLVQRIPLRFSKKPEYAFLMVVLKFVQQIAGRNADWESCLQEIKRFGESKKCTPEMVPFLTYYAFRCVQHISCITCKKHQELDKWSDALRVELTKLPRRLKNQALRELERPIRLASTG